MDARVSPAFTSFSPVLPPAARALSNAKLTSYRVERVEVVRGAPVAGIEPGQSLWRIEAPGQLVPPEAPFNGVTAHVLYTDDETRAELARVSSPESGPVAVLIPIAKTSQWWELAQDARHAYLCGASAEGHVAIGRRYASRIYRRLYHARYLPGSVWDFLTYFEFSRDDAPVFQELLAALRDPVQNPEWEFVERELEIWMAKE